MNLKYRNIAFSVATGSLLLVGLFLLLNRTPRVARADPGDLFVMPAGGGDCSQPSPCDLQTALSTASNGDVLYLAGGTYTGTGGAVVTVTESITLAGGWDGTTTTPVVRDPDTHVTKLDGQGQRRVVYISGGANPTLDGLHLHSGMASGNGGGVYAETGSNVLLSDCQIYSNTAQSRGEGGGLYIRGNVTMMDNEVYGNTVQGTHGNGAGIALITSNNAALTSNQIYDNRSLSSAGMGGGVVIYRSNATLTGNDIHDNATLGSGGGININETASNHVSLTGNRIYSNTAASGGGVMVGSCTVAMTGNLVYGNTAGRGGGLWLNISDVTLVNNIVVDNQATITSTTAAGIMVAGGDIRMLHTTIARNYGSNGSGIYVTHFAIPNYSTVAMTNTILVSHTMGIYVTAGNTATLEATLWGDGDWANGTDWSSAGTITTGTVNIWDDPAFFMPDAIDYHILPASAAVDTGVDAGVTTDVDDDLRPAPAGTLPDLGADEISQREVYLPLVTLNYQP